MPTIDAVMLAVVPKADPKFVFASLAANVPAIMAEYGLTGPNEQAQLIGQMAAECGFRTFAENLNYTAERLVQVWPSRFSSVNAAQPYARNPRALADKVYDGRMGNAPLPSDDGWSYRGSGALQHTGKSEFARVERRTGMRVVANPDRLRSGADAAVLWHAACSYFVDRGALAPARQDNTVETTKKINGGTNGLADRKVYVARAHKAMGGAPFIAVGIAPSTQAPAEIDAHEEQAAQKTTTEVSDAEKAKRNTAAAGGALATPSSGGAAANYDWVIVFCVVALVGIFAFLIVRHFARTHAAALAAVEAQQLTAIKQRLEAAEAA